MAGLQRHRLSPSLSPASEGAGANPAPTQTTVISPVTTALLPNYPNPFKPGDMDTVSFSERQQYRDHYL